MQLLSQMDGAGAGLFTFFGAMVAALFYFITYINFHLLTTKITGQTAPSKATRIWAHVIAILIALAILATAIFLDYLTMTST